MHKAPEKPWEQWYKEEMLNIQLPESSVYRLLENSANRFPNRTAIIFEDKLTDYTTLKAQIDKLAGSWKEIGLKKGDRIGIMMANHPLYIASYYAVQALGLIVVQVNPMYTSRELMQILVDSQVQYIVFDKLAKRIVEEIKKEYSFEQCFSVGEEDGYVSIQSLIEKGKAISVPEDINPCEDVAVIQYTGGTSGVMKGAMLTHYNLTSVVTQSAIMRGELLVPGEEVILTAIPLYHVYAMTVGMNLGMYLGATVLLLPKFDIQNVFDNVRNYRPTCFPGVPRMYNAFLNHPDINKYDLTCLKYCPCGSAPLPIEVIKRFEGLAGVAITEGFGMTETSTATHSNPTFAKRKVGSIGIPLPGTDCRIVDKNNAELGPNSVGELVVKGPQIMKGYWENEEETKKALQNGWLYTGDLATMDEEGYFYIVGRKKEMIIVGGFNIYPQEVESVLYEHPNILEAAVAGIPHSNLEEIVKAFIVPKVGTTIDVDEVKRFCYAKLTPYKVPKEFEVLEELPRNTVGKILKRILVKKEVEKNATT